MSVLIPFTKQVIALAIIVIIRVSDIRTVGYVISKFGTRDSIDFDTGNGKLIYEMNSRIPLRRQVY
jgi:hypothetical protein